MVNSSCVSCLRPKATLICGVCQEAVCKSCAQFIGEESFSFLGKIPESLSDGVYCRHCFEQDVQPELDSYHRTMEAAKNILVYYKAQGNETRFFSRKENLFEVTDCADHDEAILRLAFFSAKAGFNAMIDLDISSKKTRNGGYQRLVWNASARPSNVVESYRGAQTNTKKPPRK